MMNKYPATLTVDYPEEANRLTVFFRLFLTIPILIILGSLSYQGFTNDQFPNESYWVGILVVPTLLMIVFRRKYPKWWFDWNVGITKFIYRIAAYGLLLRDEYPSTDDEQAIQVDLPYPDVKKDLNRWKPLVKWILVIPHIIVLIFIFIAVVFCSVFAWFAILFTGRYPKGIFDFVEGFLRWSLRVNAYAYLLTTDEYPPFRLGE